MQATVRGGFDTFALAAKPSKEFGENKFLRLGAAQAEAFIYLRNPVPRGATVVSASLVLHARGASTGSRTLTARRVSGSWKAGRLTWDNKPGVTGASATAAVATLANGDEITLNVTADVQQFVYGVSHYGWRIVTDAATIHKVYGLDGGSFKPRLVVEWSDAPGVPTDLSPSGGAVSVAKPVVSFSYHDDDADSMTALQVQIDPAANATTPAFDSGEVAATSSELDLAATSSARTVTVNTTATSTAITAAASTFSPTLDVGQAISGTGIPIGATLATVTSGTAATLSVAATVTGAPAATITRTYLGLAVAATTQWRARVKDAGGLWSEWSDWASFSRVDHVSLTLNNPAVSPNNYVSEPTPPISWTFGGTQVAYRVRIIGSRGDVYDTGKVPGATASVTLPEKWHGRRVLVDATGYTIEVRAWDPTSRVHTRGANVYVSVTRAFTVNEDAVTTAPVAVSALQDGGSPGVVLTFTRGTSPDSFNILRDSKVIAAGLDPADLLVSGTTYTYRDTGATPGRAHTYAVRAVVTGVQSLKATATFAPVTTVVQGAWLVSADFEVMLLDFRMGGRSVDQATTYLPLGSTAHRRVIAGTGAFAGEFTGKIAASAGVDVPAMIDALEDMQADAQESVRLVVEDFSREVLLGDITTLPDETSGRGVASRVVSVAAAIWSA